MDNEKELAWAIQKRCKVQTDIAESTELAKALIAAGYHKDEHNLDTERRLAEILDDVIDSSSPRDVIISGAKQELSSLLSTKPSPKESVVKSTPRAEVEKELGTILLKFAEWYHRNNYLTSNKLALSIAVKNYSDKLLSLICPTKMELISDEEIMKGFNAGDGDQYTLMNEYFLKSLRSLCQAQLTSCEQQVGDIKRQVAEEIKKTIQKQTLLVNGHPLIEQIGLQKIMEAIAKYNL